MLFGVGVGWLKEEGEIAGNWLERYVLLGEMIQAMKELWTKDVAEFHGRLVDFPPSISMPHPKQKPHPPVLIGGGAANLDRVVAYGDGWCRASCLQASFSGSWVAFANAWAAPVATSMRSTSP